MKRCCIKQGHSTVIWAIGCEAIRGEVNPHVKWFTNLHPHRHPRYRVGAPYVSTTGQFPHGRDSTRCWKPFRGKWAHAYWRASLSSCRFVSRIFIDRAIWKNSVKLSEVLCLQTLNWIGLKTPTFSNDDVICYCLIHTVHVTNGRRCFFLCTFAAHQWFRVNQSVIFQQSICVFVQTTCCFPISAFKQSANMWRTVHLMEILLHAPVYGAHTHPDKHLQILICNQTATTRLINNKWDKVKVSVVWHIKYSMQSFRSCCWSVKLVDNSNNVG